MSLVDAIRNAAQKTELQQPVQAPHAKAEVIAFQPPVETQTAELQTAEAISAQAQEAVPQTAVEAAQMEQPSATISATPTHGVVRLELMLSPEQLHELLRGLMSGVHAVFTTREAAHYLRMTSTSLIAMAEAGSVPGFLIEGKWRFSKTTLDEWMKEQGRINQSESEQSTEARNGD